MIKMKYTFDELSVSDLHKDAYGFRPSESFWQEWTLANDDEKQYLWDSMIDVLNSDLIDEE